MQCQDSEKSSLVQINSKLNTKPCDYLYVSSTGYGVYTISATDTTAHLTTFSWSRPIRSKDPFLVCFPVAHTFFKITVWTCWWQWKKNIFSKLSDHFQTSNKEKPVWGSGLIIQQCKVRQAKRGTKKILSIFLSPFFALVATKWTS